MGCDFMCDGSSGREERRAGGQREARERRVWTARRVVVGRASHDELFFKIASTSPTTRKQKKPEILSLYAIILSISARRQGLPRRVRRRDEPPRDVLRREGPRRHRVVQGDRRRRRLCQRLRRPWLAARNVLAAPAARRRRCCRRSGREVRPCGGDHPLRRHLRRAHRWRRPQDLRLRRPRPCGG